MARASRRPPRRTRALFRGMLLSSVKRRRTRTVRPSEPYPEEQQEEQPAEASSNVDLSSQFLLVGIMLDADPRAVVVDNVSGETHFLSKGDQVNGAELLEINEGEVVFLVNNQKVRLHQ